MERIEIESVLTEKAEETTGREVRDRYLLASNDEVSKDRLRAMLSMAYDLSSIQPDTRTKAFKLLYKMLDGGTKLPPRVMRLIAVDLSGIHPATREYAFRLLEKAIDEGVDVSSATGIISDELSSQYRDARQYAYELLKQINEEENGFLSKLRSLID